MYIYTNQCSRKNEIYRTAKEDVLKTERVFSKRKKLRNLAKDLEFGSAPVKIRRRRRRRRKISDPLDFQRVEVSVFIGSLLADFRYAVHEERPIPGHPNSYIVLRLWRAARDPWNPRKGRRHRWRRREGGCTKRHVTHILPTSRESRAKKASLLDPAEKGVW